MSACKAKLVIQDRASSPVTFRCSRPSGHAGNHAAKGLSGITLRRWPR